MSTPESPMADEPTVLDSPIALALRVTESQARTGERLGLIETRLGALEDLARQQTSALADLAAALKPLHTAIEGLASIQRADVELQKRKLEHEEGAPRRMELAGKMALELMKAGGALLLAAAGGVAALWAAFKGSP